MYKKFHEFHLFAFFKEFDQMDSPLDVAWGAYLRNHKSIGSHDRKTLGDTIYSLMRWKGLLDHILGHEGSWRERFALLQTLDFAHLPAPLPTAIRSGASPWFFEELKKNYGEEKATSLCLTLNTAAPLTVRANLLKTTRETLLTSWQQFGARPCQQSLMGIQFPQRIALRSLPEFKAGFFEIQDEGSQLVANLVDAHPKEQVLDYCSGSGGKSLAIAPKLRGLGQIYLHDIRPSILQEARLRCRRAGVQNAQFLPPQHPRLRGLTHKMDWVLADVPCSGSGTYRRNPDMKWKMNEESLQNLVIEQRDIFEKAAAFAKKGGKIVYATCSILSRENEDQVNFFLKKLPLDLEKTLSILPEPEGPDGFFAAVFCKK